MNVLVDHNDQRRRDMKTWMLNTVLVVGFIQKVLGLNKSNCGDLFSEESIHRAIGLLRTNSVKLDSHPGNLQFRFFEVWNKTKERIVSGRNLNIIIYHKKLSLFSIWGI